jgi:hypothetical protein
METKECVICLNDISINDYYTLTCCKNDVHICCLNDWVDKNITKKNISRCFICSQENSIIATMVSYNKSNHNNNITVSTYDYDDTNSITNDNNSINNEIVLYNDNHMLTISYNIDKRLYYLFISIKLCFFISVSSLLILVLYFII